MRERFLALPISRTYIFGEGFLPNPDAYRLAAQRIQVLVILHAGHPIVLDDPERRSTFQTDYGSRHPRIQQHHGRAQPPHSVDRGHEGQLQRGMNGIRRGAECPRPERKSPVKVYEDIPGRLAWSLRVHSTRPTIILLSISRGSALP